MHGTYILRWTSFVCIVAWLGCAPDEPQSDGEQEVDLHQEAIVSRANPVFAIAAAGHGKVFGNDLRELTLSLERIADWQEAMRKDILLVTHGRFTLQTDLFLKEAELLLAGEYRAQERALVRGAVIWRMLQEVPLDWLDEFEWRNEVLNSAIFLGRPPQLSIRIIDFIRRIGYTNWERRFFRWRSYIDQCRLGLVPIPPNWAEHGTPWVYQGMLTYNILSPGGVAHVWTYRDPLVRGGCVALPRDGGEPGSPAGIICQSAATGKACFWDNKLRSEVPERFLGWSGQTLEIRLLRDGTNLEQSCTACHRGNNVFLMTPDDPVWAKLMRDGLTGGTGRFTTRVLASSDYRDGHPRYVPWTGIPSRAGWENTYTPPGCAGDCHETPRVSPIAGTMPPACGTSCSTF